MSDLNSAANHLRALATAGLFDTDVVAQGLRDVADVCSTEQSALKTRLLLAATIIERVPNIAELIGTLQGAAVIIRNLEYQKTASKIDAVVARATARVFKS